MKDNFRGDENDLALPDSRRRSLQYRKSTDSKVSKTHKGKGKKVKGPSFSNNQQWPYKNKSKI